MSECKFLKKYQISEDIANKIQWDEENKKELAKKHYLDIYHCQDMVNSMNKLDECKDCPYILSIKKMQDKWK